MSIERPTHFHQEKQFPPILNRVAEIHGIKLTDEEINNIEIIVTTCGIADDIIDQCPDPEVRKAIAENAFLFLEDKQDELLPTQSRIHPAYEESMGLLKDFVISQPLYKREVFISCLRIWNKLSERRRAEEDLNRSLKLRKADLGFTASIYLAGISENNRSNPEYRKFVKDVKRMVRIAGMLDDASDLPRDFNDKVVPITPNLGNRTRILGDGVFMGMRLMKCLFNVELVYRSFEIMVREFKRRGEHNTDQYKFQQQSKTEY